MSIEVREAEACTILRRPESIPLVSMLLEHEQSVKTGIARRGHSQSYSCIQPQGCPFSLRCAACRHHS